MKEDTKLNAIIRQLQVDKSEVEKDRRRHQYVSASQKREGMLGRRGKEGEAEAATNHPKKRERESHFSLIFALKHKGGVVDKGNKKNAPGVLKQKFARIWD